jgi:hypothetical protein
MSESQEIGFEQYRFDHPQNVVIGTARIIYMPSRIGPGAWALLGGSSTASKDVAIVYASKINTQYPMEKP